MGQPQRFGQETLDSGVRLAIDRRRRDPHPEDIALPDANLVSRGSRRHSDPDTRFDGLLRSACFEVVYAFRRVWLDSECMMLASCEHLCYSSAVLQGDGQQI